MLFCTAFGWLVVCLPPCKLLEVRYPCVTYSKMFLKVGHLTPQAVLPQTGVLLEKETSQRVARAQAQGKGKSDEPSRKDFYPLWDWFPEPATPRA